MQSLQLIAGRQAATRIEEKGLTPGLVTIIPGASGSAKWLVLAGLDQFIFGDWLAEAKNPIQLIGSSIGAWRMSVAAQHDAKKAFETFIEGYLSFQVWDGMSSQDITDESYRTMETFLDLAAREEAVTNPMRQLNIIAVKGKGLCGKHNKAGLAAGLLGAMGKNMISRKHLARSFDRVLMRSQAGGVSTEHFIEDPFVTKTADLTVDNLHDAVMASGAIPFVTVPVEKISGLPEGLYMDGGVTDYHFDVDWQVDEGIVLYPHFYDYIIPGWFDKSLNRRATPERMKNVLMLAPTREWVAGLPGGKIPERQNFSKMTNEDRIAFWKHCVAESQRLADEFAELLEKPQKLMDRMVRL